MSTDELVRRAMAREQVAVLLEVVMDQIAPPPLSVST
jgi:hypothetical protein